MIRIGSRGSALARWQAEHVKSRLEALGHAAAIEWITTTGDRLLDRRLDSVGGKGAFLKEIEEALLERRIDLAVHSLKDVPTAQPPGLTLCGFLERADASDAAVSRSGQTLARLAGSSRVGTTSLRRQAQLRAWRGDLTFVELRGNVDTRIRRLHEGACDVVLLAAAGLARLGRAHEITEVLDVEVMLPAPGQGVVALECGTDDAAMHSAAVALSHGPTALAVRAERSLLAALGGGCNVPLGAYAVLDGDRLRLRALVARADGTRVLRAEGRGQAPDELGRALAEDLLSQGARELLRP